MWVLFGAIDGSIKWKKLLFLLIARITVKHFFMWFVCEKSMFEQSYNICVSLFQFMVIFSNFSKRYIIIIKKKDYTDGKIIHINRKIIQWNSYNIYFITFWNIYIIWFLITLLALLCLVCGLTTIWRLPWLATRRLIHSLRLTETGRVAAHK